MRDNNFRVLFVNVGHQVVDIYRYISPVTILDIFKYIFDNNTISQVNIEIYGLSSLTDYFTHFIEYTIPINDNLSYQLVYYLNINDQSINKYYINLIDHLSNYESNTIYSENFTFNQGQKINHCYVLYNCYELGFAIAEKVELILPSICKFCKYKTYKSLIPCTVHPTLHHKTLTECKDFESIKHTAQIVIE